ncbi:hypothetical protein FDA94_28770 [Herbidospora galbida]|uniref:Uncharacterized protein n=1 Tax=Herbidospora galbida TaxID=2575442 RepID=A0A4U3M6R7_9ACTN|nr:hypothetical protein [Herbidospora galbida]TKK84625.1 hypothetical protein FDA94_28770 [Herbidospora galbida]
MDIRDEKTLIPVAELLAKWAVADADGPVARLTRLYENTEETATFRTILMNASVEVGGAISEAAYDLMFSTDPADDESCSVRRGWVVNSAINRVSESHSWIRP